MILDDLNEKEMNEPRVEVKQCSEDLDIINYLFS